MKLNKILSLVFISIFLISSVYSLRIEPQASPQITPQNQSALAQAWENINWGLIGIIGGISIGTTIFLGVIFFIVFKIWQKINDLNKSKDNIEYAKYLLDLRLIKLNANKNYKGRSWYTFFLFSKNAKVYANTSFGKKYLGKYMGECAKKEGYFIFGLEMSHSLLKKETDVVIFPYKIAKHLIKYNDDYTITLECEGVDETLSSEYFSIPILTDKHSNDKDSIFLDFSNQVMEKYYKTYVYRNVIKEQTGEYRNNMKEAVEMNASLQMERKRGD